jgi:hypothetical protein
MTYFLLPAICCAASTSFGLAALQWPTNTKMIIRQCHHQQLVDEHTAPWGIEHHQSRFPGLELLLNPEKVNEPRCAYDIMSNRMVRGVDVKGSKKLASFIVGQSCDYVGARALVNPADSTARTPSGSRGCKASRQM